MTKDQIEQNAAAYVAAKSGKPWQWQSVTGEWENADCNYTILMALSDGSVCRPTPEPQPPKPWDGPDDVPGPVCWIGEEGDDDDLGCGSMVVGIDREGVNCLNSLHLMDYYSWVEIAGKKMEYSIDRKTWKPCHKAP